MERTTDINQIVQEIEKLGYREKINILSRVVNLLKREEKNQRTSSITSLKGLGKDVWKETDIDTYLSTERESWE